MNFADIIKKSVLEKFQTGDITTTTIITTLGISVLLGLFIYLIYRINTKSGFYNRGFNNTLAILPSITAAIMLAMSSSLTISLGMVGALSIVRFRNAVKDSSDLTYLFWSISIGIIVGAGLLELAVILCLIAAVLLSTLDLIPLFRAPSLLIVSGNNSTLESELLARIKQHARTAKIRSRNIRKTGTEWILELKVRNEAALLETIAALEGIESVHLMTHDGDARL